MCKCTVTNHSYNILRMGNIVFVVMCKQQCSQDNMQRSNSDIHSHVLGIYYLYCQELCVQKKKKNPFNCNSIKPFSSTLVCKLCYMIVLLWTNNTLLQLPVLSLQAPLYISSALQYSHYYAKRAGFIFEGFKKSRETKGSTLSEWVRLQAWNGRGGN